MEDNKNKTKKKDKNKDKKKRKISLKVIIIALVIILGLFASLIGFITDYLWFKELGYVSVFLKQLFTQLKIGIPVFIVVTLLSYIYFKRLKINYYKKVESRDIDRSKSVNIISWVMAGIFGAIVTYFAVTQMWFDSLQFANSTDFDVKDPLFGMDTSFYVMKLDFIKELNSLLLVVLVVFIILTLGYYAMLMSTRKPAIFDDGSSGTDGSDFGSDGFGQSSYSSYQSDSSRNNGFANNYGQDGGLFGKIAQSLENFFNRFQSGGTGYSGSGSYGGSQRGGSGANKENIRQLLAIASKQIIIVGALFFLMLGIHFFLKQYELLHAHTGVVYGAGFTDVHVTLLVYRILMVLSVLGMVAVVIGVKKHRVRFIAAVPVLMIVVSLAGTGIGMLVQNFVVSPDEISKESKYLERNIDCTQQAYDLADVKTKNFSADSDLTAEDIKNNDPTISNIRINDYSPTEKFYNQTQSIRQYYEFKSIDVDRYMVNGDYTQTFLSPREIDEEKISETWLNRHLKYSHGYGITMSQVDKVTASGQPDMLVKNIPPESSVKEIDITRPEIYFGEQTNEYIIVDTNEDEFDYPDGDSNKYTRYEGSAGIRLNLLNRLMFAVREHSFKLLVSSNIKSKSKIIINRNIDERIRKIMPYLEYDDDPYMCTADGKLYWIIDAYTTTDKYPYSEPFDESGTNYIRNSVKVVVDAYNGDVNYYIVDNDDAIAKTFQKIYPKLFKDADKMPEGIRSHIRYPNKMFDTQSKVYRRYHMNDVKVFYQNEDMWDISNEIYGTKEVQMEPHYYILNLPGEKDEEFVNSIPFTPKDKKNLTGLFVARSDGDHYGELVLYKLPKSKVIYGPMQIEAQIDQNTEISKEFSLWNSAGSDYSRGNMFVIPIENSLLYVEPVYLEATNSSIPEVKRVIVAYNDQIAYKPTLAEALNELFGEGSGDKYSGGDLDKDGSDKTESKQLTQSEIIKKAQDAYDDAQAAMKKGDWAEYGKHMDELEKYLKKLK